jgi:hypothetical protein
MSSSGDEAQREMEQRALQNVRGLVDKMKREEEADARVQKRLLIAILVGALLVVIAIAAVILERGDKYKPVAIDPAKLPPVRAGPPK